MKKLFTIIAVVAMSLVAMAQTNQLVWSNGRLIYGTSIETIDSLTFGGMEDVDTLQLLLPRMLTIIQRDTITQIQYDTITQIITQIERDTIIQIQHDTIIQIERDTIIKFDTIYINNGGAEPELTYELRTLTFEDADAKFTPYTLDYANKAINKWSDLVDDAQYGGTLTYNNYGEATYFWHDGNNTELKHSFTTPYWGGGHAISNYVINGYSNDDLPEGMYGWYEAQFATTNGGNNGSNNFCVHNGYMDFFNTGLYDASLQTIEFADGVERIVDHMYVNNICYVLNSLTYGDGFCSAATDTTQFVIVAYGYDAEGNEVGTARFKLCDGKDNIVKEWTKWDLSSLGKVAKIAFNFEASGDIIGDYGLNCPAYFAYDDVTVRFDKK